MKAFNLEAALAGDAVIMRTGQPVKIMKLALPTPVGSVLVSQTLDGNLCTHSSDGVASYSTTSPYDLFMAPKTKTIYINLWDSPSFHYSAHESLGAAKSASGCSVFKRLNPEPIVLTVEV